MNINTKRLLAYGLVLVGFFGAVQATPAADGKAGRKKKPSYVSAAATVEQYMDMIVTNLGYRYSLNEAQLESTRELLHRRVYDFIREHESEVWPAIQDMLSTKFGMQLPDDVNETTKMAKTMQPLMKAIQKAIFDGNDEWRELLTPEQKVMHDYDLSQMRTTFEKIETNLKDLSAGKMTGGGIIPPTDNSNSPPIPQKPKHKGIPEPEAPVLFNSDMFDIFVEEFIKDNDLDEGQIDAARSILKEFKLKAKDFAETNRSNLTRIALANKEAAKKRDREALRKLDGERKLALRPVHELFAQMETRLKALLNSSQMARYNARKTGVGTTDGKKTKASKSPVPAKSSESAGKPTPNKSQKPAKKESQKD